MWEWTQRSGLRPMESRAVLSDESITVRLSEWHRLQDENRVKTERIAELEQLLAARPQEECAQRLTLQSDGSLRCHHCGHVVPKFESKR